MEITASPEGQDIQTQMIPTTEPEPGGTGKAGRPLGRHARKTKKRPVRKAAGKKKARVRRPAARRRARKKKR